MPPGGTTTANGLMFPSGQLPQVVFQDDGAQSEAVLDASTQRLTLGLVAGGDGVNRSLLRFSTGSEVWYVRLYTQIDARPGFLESDGAAPLLASATGCSVFGYAGGVASNIKVNRLIRTTPGIARLEVCPAMGDGGLALGAALAGWHRLSGRRPAPFADFRLGRDHGDLGVDAEAVARATGATLTRPPDIAAAAAARLAAGEVVMWAQGRMELGARALGARSIVARADSVAARDDLNLRLKRRVWYQPFCPSILLSEAPSLLADYRGDRDVNRHMTMGFLTTPRGRAALAGAVGPDGSCRPQMVAADPAEPWYRLLENVRALTGSGAVINTSLNMQA